MKSPVSWSFALADDVGFFLVLAGGEGCVCLKQLNLVWVVVRLLSSVLKIVCLAQVGNQTNAFR